VGVSSDHDPVFTYQPVLFAAKHMRRYRSTSGWML
jgi:hypothetical protein